MIQEKIAYDIVIVGAGPAGLATAIHLKQLCQKSDQALSVCILEKGSFVGAHIVSGTVFDSQSLTQLLPNWQTLNPPGFTPLCQQKLWYLTKKRAYSLFHLPGMKSRNHYLISLGRLCAWLAEQAESLGVDILPGIAASQLLFDQSNRVCGILTHDAGMDKKHQPTARYQPGFAIKAKQVVLAEGCRGSLSEIAIKHFKLRTQLQTYGIGIKEQWEVDNAHYQPGLAIHTLGWPLDSKTYGGAFIYHHQNHQLSVGLILGLDYQNPYLDPFEEMQQLKTHPAIRPFLVHGERIGYGARALNEGGFQAVPKLTFPGGLLVGDAAGFLNMQQLKGSHNAIYSGMTAAKHLLKTFQSPTLPAAQYQSQIEQQPFWQALYRARNIRPGFQYGLWPGLVHAAIDTLLFRGRAPWTLKHRVDHLATHTATCYQPKTYPLPDYKLTFDKSSSLYLANITYDANQPSHLKLCEPELAIAINHQFYQSLETRYCPANVYEILYHHGKPQLQINAQNCIHCKTCDIKDPKQNITWTPPEGGHGPNYTNL